MYKYSSYIRIATNLYFQLLANPDQTPPAKPTPPKGKEPEKSIVIHTLTIDIYYVLIYVILLCN